MRTLLLLLFPAMACMVSSASAVDYIVDFTRIEDFETLRPVIDGCADFDSLELYRDRISSSSDLNELREVFQRTGLGLFNRCPEGITGSGISLVK